MVELEIKKQYGKFRLDVAFKSEKKRIGILGASGCGKSLTLKSIAGIERPEKGRIVIDGVTLFDAGKKDFSEATKKESRLSFSELCVVSEHDRGAEYRDWIYWKQRR